MKSQILLFTSFILINQTWAQESIYQPIMNEVKAKSVFKIKTPNTHCPDSVRLAESGPNSAFEIKEGDILIELKPIQKEGAAFSYFVFERNTILLKAGLRPGKKKKIKFGCEYFNGILCSSASIEELTGVFNYKSAISKLMIISVASQIEFDSNNRSVKYSFQSNEVEDVVCEYIAED